MIVIEVVILVVTALVSTRRRIIYLKESNKNVFINLRKNKKKCVIINFPSNNTNSSGSTSSFNLWEWTQHGADQCRFQCKSINRLWGYDEILHLVNQNHIKVYCQDGFSFTRKLNLCFVHKINILRRTKKQTAKIKNINIEYKMYHKMMMYMYNKTVLKSILEKWL